jgi:hypothetical protein
MQGNGHEEGRSRRNWVNSANWRRIRLAVASVSAEVFIDQRFPKEAYFWGKYAQLTLFVNLMDALHE